MDYIKDFFEVYKKSLGETGKILTKAPLIIILPLIFSIVSTLVYTGLIAAFSNLGIILGFILAIVEAILLSAYFSFLDEAINYHSFKLTIDKSLMRYARAIYAVKFIFYLASILAGNILALGPISIIVFILLNPLGESIYLGQRYGLDAINYSFSYLGENWYLWLPHTLLFVALGKFRYLFFTANPLNIYVTALSFNPVDLVIMAALGIYFIFRGVLFKNTRNSSMRKRKYMGAWK